MAMYDSVKGGVRSPAECSESNGRESPERTENMSTRAAIGMRLADGTIKAIYCHNDGYPGWTGAILGGWYTDPEKVKSLVDLGALSILGEKLEPAPGATHTYDNPQTDVTIAYHRDRNDPLIPANSYADLEEYAEKATEDFSADYLYLFEDGAWSFFEPYGKREWTALDVTVGGRD